MLQDEGAKLFVSLWNDLIAVSNPSPTCSSGVFLFQGVPADEVQHSFVRTDVRGG